MLQQQHTGSGSTQHTADDAVYGQSHKQARPLADNETKQPATTHAAIIPDYKNPCYMQVALLHTVFSARSQ
jgi:hypothetical protein